jgi:hypothetical protein
MVRSTEALTSQPERDPRGPTLRDRRRRARDRNARQSINAFTRCPAYRLVSSHERFGRDTLRRRVKPLEFSFFACRDHPTEVKHDDEPVAHLAHAPDVLGIDARNEVRRVLDLLDGDS